MAEHVLVPVDGSPQSEAAFDWAVEEFDDARLTVVHIVHPSDTSHKDGDTVDAKKVLMSEASQVLGRYDAEGVDINKKMKVSRREAAGVVDCVEETGTDVVVMGSHGRSGVSRVVLGSVAEGVVRKSPVPVVVVR
jgi:nucleotide-binding universal stress UspA family protein